MRSRIVSVAAVIIAVVGAALAGWLQPLDDALTDFRFAWSGRAASGNIAIVDIDSKTLAAIGRWPLPRRLYGDAIDRLVGLGAAEIAFDIDFSAASTPEDDAAMEAALARAGDSVILAAFDQPVTAGGQDRRQSSDRAVRETCLARRRQCAPRPRRKGPPPGLWHRGRRPIRYRRSPRSTAAGRHASGQEFRIDFGIDGDGDRPALADRPPAGQGRKEPHRGQEDHHRRTGGRASRRFPRPALRRRVGQPCPGARRRNHRRRPRPQPHEPRRYRERPRRRRPPRLFHCGTGDGRCGSSAIGIAALALEAIAILVQRAFPLEVATAAWQAALLGYARAGASPRDRSPAYPRRHIAQRDREHRRRSSPG